MGKIETNVKDALDKVRAATQELHKTISDDVTKRGGATKADLETFAQKAKAATEAAKASIATQNAAAKMKLSDATAHLEAVQKNVADSLKSSGEAFRTSVQKALADASAAAQRPQTA